jgi:hypothetical protein
VFAVAGEEGTFAVAEVVLTLVLVPALAAWVQLQQLLMLSQSR